MSGLLVLVASAALVVWLVAGARAPGLDRLEQVTGRVKSATSSDGQTTGRRLTLVVTADDVDYELVLPHAEQLPPRDWPLESLKPGVPVIAWYIPARGTKSRGTLWQLHRGQQRVVALQDTGALYREWVRNTLSWCTVGLLAGAALMAAGFGARNRAPPLG
jgi:hypothetical protein